MKKRTAFGLLLFVLAGGFLFAHRRVIKALINNEPIPKAPEWHFWVKKEGRVDGATCAACEEEMVLEEE